MVQKNNSKFIRFVQIYVSYSKRDDPKLCKEQRERLVAGALDVIKSGAIYTCSNCGHKTGLSFIESKHDCSNPMFDKEGMPLEQGIIAECTRRNIDFEKVKASITFNEQAGEPPK